MLIMSYSSLGNEQWYVLMRNHTVLPETHTFFHKRNEPYLPLTPSCRASPYFCLVLISRPTDSRRLSWPGRLGEILRWFAHPKTVTHPSICHGCQAMNLQPWSRKSNALTTTSSLLNDQPVLIITLKTNDKVFVMVVLDQ